MKRKISPIIMLILLLPVTYFSLVNGADSYTKQDFTLSNETEVFLDMESNFYYNGTLNVVLSSGDNVTATLNGNSKEVSIDNSQEFQIFNVTSIYFTLSTEGSAEGYFELSLIIEYNYEGNRSLYITLAALGGLFFLAAAISYVVRSKRLETKPEEEDEELTDPETLRKRREAAGAQEKYLGLDKKK